MEKENVNPTPEENEEVTAEVTEQTDEAAADVVEQTAEDTAPAEEITEVEPIAEENASAEPEYTYTSRKNRKSEKASGKFKARYVIIPLVIIALLTGGFFALPFIHADGLIANNVWVRDLDLSGLTVEEAEELISTEYNPTETDFSVVFATETDSVSAEFTAEEIEYAVDIKGTASDAYAFARSGNWLDNALDTLRLLFTKVDIGAKPNYNDEVLSEILYNLGAQIHGEGKDVEIIIENDTLSITPAEHGQSHDVRLAKAEFSNSVRKGITHDIPVTLFSNESDKLDANELYKELSVEAKDAEYKIENNEVIITDHVVGVEINKAKLSALVEQVNNGIAGKIDVKQTVPEITTESIQKSLFGTTLATYSSNYSSSSANRAYNVELAASKINGLILPDGAEFSYNGTVGNANAANGFKMATIFSDGKKTEGVGGGVCQVSSTLYCSVLRADLEVTERHNHSLPIAYVPGGQDATVSYGVLDFRFKNNTGAPIKLEAVCAGRNLTVSILGSAEAKKNVEVVSQKVSTLEPTMTEIPDPSLPIGTTQIVSKGSAGSVYVAYKRVLDENGKVIKETSTRSTYRATAGEVNVGTAEVAAPAPEPDVPASNPETPAVTPDEPTDTTEPPAADINSTEPELMENGYPAGL